MAAETVVKIEYPEKTIQLVKVGANFEEFQKNVTNALSFSSKDYLRITKQEGDQTLIITKESFGVLQHHAHLKIAKGIRQRRKDIWSKTYNEDFKGKVVIMVVGPPGHGKSSLINSLLSTLCDNYVSSARTGGAKDDNNTLTYDQYGGEKRCRYSSRYSEAVKTQLKKDGFPENWEPVILFDTIGLPDGQLEQTRTGESFKACIKGHFRPEHNMQNSDWFVRGGGYKYITNSKIIVDFVLFVWNVKQDPNVTLNLSGFRYIHDLMHFAQPPGAVGVVLTHCDMITEEDDPDCVQKCTKFFDEKGAKFVKVARSYGNQESFEKRHGEEEEWFFEILNEACDTGSATRRKR